MESDADGKAIAQIDAALIRMRRLLDVPRVVDDPEGPVESSTLLVVNAITTAGQPMTITAIAEALDVTHSTASRLVSRAVVHGMVEKSSAAGSRRETAVGLTAAGAGLQRRAVAFRHARLGPLLAGFTGRERQDFAVLLSRFAEAMHRSGAEGK